MVEFQDGAVKAQLGVPDMKLPIQYALYYPQRRPLQSGRLDFSAMSLIMIEKPDTEVFEGLKMAYEVGKKGGNLPTVFNAANEYAVARFLRNEISFLEIADDIRYALSEVKYREAPDLQTVLETEKETIEVLNCRAR